MKEIDLLIEWDGILYLIDIKKHSDTATKDISAFNVFGKFSDVKRESKE